MEKNIKSEWWFLANINFVTVGISYFIYLIILLIGNFVDAEVMPGFAAAVIALIFILSDFLASKLAFREAKIEKKPMIKYFVLNLILFLIISYKFSPLVAGYIGFEITNTVLMSMLVAIVAFAVNALFVVNMND